MNTYFPTRLFFYQLLLALLIGISLLIKAGVSAMLGTVVGALINIFFEAFSFYALFFLPPHQHLRRKILRQFMRTKALKFLLGGSLLATLIGLWPNAQWSLPLGFLVPTIALWLIPFDPLLLKSAA